MVDFRGGAEDGECPDDKQMIGDDGEEQMMADAKGVVKAKQMSFS